MTVDSWGAWAAVVGIVVVLLVLDFMVAARRPHAVELKEAAFWSVFYLGAGLLFGLALWPLAGPDIATEYFAGLVVEKSLSVDNLFVFVVIMSRFAVPARNRQKTLLFGIAAALVMRMVLITAGAAAISLFSPTFLLFGVLLLWTAVQLFRHRKNAPDPGDNPLLRWVRRVLPVTDDLHDGRLLAREDGRRVITPLFLVFVAIGSTDLLFALDSIPAIFGITQHPLLVFSANAFALLGLRALYFLIEGLLERLVHLSIGLSAILAFIGVKLILVFLHRDVSAEIPEIPTPASLGVILTILLVTVVLSLRRVRRHPEERAHAGAPYRGSGPDPDGDPGGGVGGGVDGDPGGGAEGR
ncbi:TerC family protein [Planomonospora sp. ID82291]|uniref:TerC family protein n=1 Tax=Planomonospora sp. ID82291 TaxID=2738136 RepID=UPI0018C419C9|nr:TerC family protein [Planomonospora sp. ID82291]MBG0818877.1 TerC family protein [Planomonospora sp. ID82291]